MILRSLRVQGWRCFADACEVGPLGEGLNVVHGPNGSGKSTLLWALARGLFDGHKVTGVDIESLRPWGRQLTPRVEIEFDHDDAQYRLQKQFLNSQSAELARRENGSFVRLAEATQADDLVRELLSAEPPKRGPSRDRHWGFAQVLWATQGALHIEQLSDGTRNSIHDSLGAQIAGPGGEEIEQQVARLYNGIFTATGKIKGGAGAPPIVKLEEQLTELQQQRAEASTKLVQFDEASRRVEDLRLTAEQSRAKEAGLKKDLEQATKAAEAYAKLVQQQQLQVEKEKNARNVYEQLAKRIERIDQLCKSRKEQDEQLESLTQQIADFDEQYQTARTATEEAKLQLRDVRARRSKLDEQSRLARQAEKYVAAVAEANALAMRIENVQQATEERDRLQRAASEIVAPDAKTLKKIQQAARQRDAARVKLDAASMRVTIAALRDLTLENVDAEQSDATNVAAETTLELQGSPEVSFTLPGIATIRATGPTESAEQLKDTLRKAQATMEDLTAGLGTSDVAELETAAQRAQEAASAVREAQVRLDTLLAGDQLAELRQEHVRASAIIAELLQASPDWKDTPPDATALATGSQDAQAQFDRDLAKAEQRDEAADEAFSTAQQKHLEFQSQLKSARQACESTARQLAEAEDDGLEAAARQESRDDLALTWRAEKAALAKLEKEIETHGDDPRELANTLREQRESLAQQVTNAEIQLAREETQLQSIIQAAPYSALAQVEEQIQRVEQEIGREQLNNEAIRLLHETFVEQKRSAFTAVIEPVQQRANRTLQRIAGGRFTGIEFDDSFLPTGVRPSAMDEAVVLDYLSGGEQEQVHFAVRLALADVAFGDARQLVVLDDAFTATDTPRLARIIKVLEEAAERFQILLLSCHPERYQHLRDVKFFDLPQLIAASNGSST